MAVIAHAGFLHETNTFAPVRTTWEDFVREESFPGLTLGDAILERFRDINVGTSGFIAEALKLGHELKPIAWCAAVPAAHVSEDAFETYAALLLEQLEALQPYDAVYLDLHGAMVTEHHEDGEGELLRRVREFIGPEMPLVVSLDLHSNTTDAMAELSDGLVAYRTYPHVDMADTGARAARYLHRLLHGAVKPAMARRAVPFLIPLTGQCTMVEPTKGVYERLAALEAEDPDILVLSFTPGFPPADIWDCGPVVLAFAKTQAAADRAADALFDYIMEREAEFQVPMLTPGDAVARAIRSNAHKPTVLADVQDNCGAGATSDTTGILRAMVAQNADRALIGVLVDPAAAAAAHAAGEGAEIDIEVGGKLYTDGDPPFRGRFRVEKLTDGRFTCTGPFYKGVTPNLGPCAILTIGGVSVLVSTGRIQAADKEIFRHAGKEPSEQKILALKSSVHFRGDFTDIAEEVIVVDAPGAFRDRPEKMPYRNLRPGLRLCPKGPVFEGA